MLVVEQNLDFALRIADRWAALKLGKIDDEGPGGPDMRPASSSTSACERVQYP